jgi:hypothetical protein
MMRRNLLAACGLIVLLLALGLVFYVRSRNAELAAIAPAAVPAPGLDSASPPGTAPAPQPMDLDSWKTRIAQAEDLSALMKEALLIADADLKQAVVASLIDRWLLVDAKGFIKFINALEVGGDRASLAVMALALQESLTRLSPETAGSDEILTVVQRLISWLASTDPIKALEWAQRYLLEDTLDQALVTIARGLTRSDVPAAIRIAEGIQSPLRRSQAMAAVGTGWAARNPTEALKWVVSLKNHAERALALNAVLLVTAGRDLPVAARSLSGEARFINEQYVRDRAARMAAAGVTEADLANDPESYREMLESGAIPPPSSPDIELLAGAGRVIASKLASDSAAEGVRWAEALEGDYLKLTSLSGALDSWGKTDPEAALAFVSQNYPANNDLHTSVYRAWATADPRAAAEAAQQIGDPYRRTVVMENVIKVWAAAGEANAAADFLGTLPVSPSTDAASSALAAALSHQQPERAWQIARGISNESAQYRAHKSAFAVLVTRDPDAAGQLLHATTLPAQTRQLLSDMLSAVHAP